MFYLKKKNICNEFYLRIDVKVATSLATFVCNSFKIAKLKSELSLHFQMIKTTIEI